MSDETNTGGGEATAEPANADRRVRQRFIARRHGRSCFWLAMGGERIALNDLSLEGFSASLAPPPRGEFAVVLQRDGVPDEIHCTAIVVNQVPGPCGPASGCRFVGLSPENADRLQEWLVTHVIMSATVRISEKDAVMIVQGRSLV
ncbi:PilZ domain-containing protein [Thauera sp. 2A1]|uniref:PilZ domain-containing protein n=1 Tax=Thauera sp. 2A1 TaxID=2570191 RepID=UPI001291F32C|nr:PilZ domain-containing protein [Thauera sp. 2A1]KAI5915486.1 PilZ domain-containing protein [Thauera sp. 2A1]